MPKTQPYESNYNTAANNFLQVIYSFKNQYSYDVAMNYLTYYCYLKRNTRLHTKFMAGVSIS